MIIVRGTHLTTPTLKVFIDNVLDLLPQVCSVTTIRRRPILSGKLWSCKFFEHWLISKLCLVSRILMSKHQYSPIRVAISALCYCVVFNLVLQIAFSISLSRNIRGWYVEILPDIPHRIRDFVRRLSGAPPFRWARIVLLLDINAIDVLYTLLSNLFQLKFRAMFLIFILLLF